jgi:hypothetical protein
VIAENQNWRVASDHSDADQFCVFKSSRQNFLLCNFAELSTAMRFLLVIILPIKPRKACKSQRKQDSFIDLDGKNTIWYPLRINLSIHDGEANIPFLKQRKIISHIVVFGQHRGVKSDPMELSDFSENSSQPIETFHEAIL